MRDNGTPGTDQEQLGGFVDVLGSRSSWPVVDQRGADAYLSGRRRLPLPNGPITIECADLPTGAEGSATLPGDEFVLVLSGSLSFSQAGRELRLKTGDAAVVLRDEPLEWSAGTLTELIIMRCTAGGSAGAEAPVMIDVDAPLVASNPPLKELLVGPVPSCRNHTDYVTTSGEFICGTWDSTPYHRELMTFRHYELMRLLEGQVTYVDEQGTSATFGAGDVVLFVQGRGCSWESREHVKKIYSTYRPAQ